MTDRFAASEGEVWDQTTLPHRKLDLDDANHLLEIWVERANECRAVSKYAEARCWSMPAASLRAAINQAESQRRLRLLQGRPIR